MIFFLYDEDRVKSEKIHCLIIKCVFFSQKRINTFNRIKGHTETPRISQYDGTEGFEIGPQFGPYKAERKKPLGQPIIFFQSGPDIKSPESLSVKFKLKLSELS